MRTYLGGTISDHAIKTKLIYIQEHWQQHHFGQFTVYEKNTNQIIGICGLHNSEEGIEITYMFFPTIWGKGFVTEATVASLHDSFTCLQFDQIIAITQESNKLSWKLLEKIGMYHSNTIWRYDAVQRVYALTKIQWLTQYKQNAA